MEDGHVRGYHGQARSGKKCLQAHAPKLRVGFLGRDKDIGVTIKDRP